MDQIGEPPNCLDPEALREAVQAKSGMRVPDLYLTLVRDDAFSHYGFADFEAWRDGGGREGQETTPPIVDGADVEWLFFSEVAQVNRKDYWIEDLVLVPFAHNGAGDVYCWSPAHETAGRVPVVLAPHDDEEATILAPDLQGFLDRKAIEQYVSLYEVTEPELAKLIALAWFERVGRYLSEGARAAVEEISQREPRPDDLGEYGFVSVAEAESLVKRILGDERVDTTFPHMRGPG